MKYAMYGIGLIGAILLLIAFCLFSAWAYSIAWLWLAVPIFKAKRL